MEGDPPDIVVALMAEAASVVALLSVPLLPWGLTGPALIVDNVFEGDPETVDAVVMFP